MTLTDQSSLTATVLSLLAHAEELLDAGRVREALRILTQFLGRKHLEPRLQPALAGLYLRAGKPDYAVRTMHHAIDEAPADPELHNALGLIFAKIGREGESRQEFELALSIEPLNAEALRNLAFILHRSGERPSAYALLVRCFEATPMSVELRLICGTMLELDGELDDAANCYRDVTELGGVSEQVQLAMQRMFALGDDRPAFGFEEIMARLKQEHVG